MSNSLAPALLLSMPQLQDPNFHRAVVLLCEHAPEGAFGLVLNRPTDLPASNVVRLDPPVLHQNGTQLWLGGPVEPQRGWLLVDEEPVEAESTKILDGLYLSSSPLVLRRVLESTPPPRVRVFAGYAGWGPAQLEGELAESAWLLADVDLDLVFDFDPASIWETAIRRLGADPTKLQMSRGVH